jgi:hypothetical protein
LKKKKESAMPNHEVDWKKRYDELQTEHQLALERIRLHYDHELKEKLTGKRDTTQRSASFSLSCLEIRLALKHEYDEQFAAFRTRLLEQQQQLLLQKRLSIDDDDPLDDDVKRLVHKLHTEGMR